MSRSVEEKGRLNNADCPEIDCLLIIIVVDLVCKVNDLESSFEEITLADFGT